MDKFVGVLIAREKYTGQEYALVGPFETKKECEAQLKETAEDLATMSYSSKSVCIPANKFRKQ